MHLHSLRVNSSRSIILALCASSSLASLHANAQLRHGTAADIGNGVTANEADGVRLRAHLTLADMSIDTGLVLTSGNDCWGYTSPTNRSYALMGTDKATVIYDVTDPFNPVYVTHITHAVPDGTLWSDIKTYQQFAYVVTDGSVLSRGLQVLDLSAIDAGTVTLVNELQPSGLKNVHNLAINETSGKLYACLPDAIATGFIIFDLAASPTNPPVVGSYSLAGVHDAHVVTMTTGPWAGKEIAFCFAEGLGIDIVDCTNPAVPIQLSRTTYANLAYAHQGWFVESTNLLYMGDELDEWNFGIDTSLRIFDVSDLANPVLANTVTNGRKTIDHNLYIKNNTLYEANYVSGVHVYDLSTNPTSPTHTGYFDTVFEQERVTFDGAWNVFPFFNSDIILVSDLSAGLFVLDAQPAANGGMPLSFSYPNGIPSVLPPIGAALQVNITGLNANTVNSASGMLHIIANGITSDFPLTHLAGDLYEAQFPTLPCGIVNYYISATASNALNINSPLHAPVEGFTASVLSTFTQRLFETGESALDWTLGLPSDTATTGMWERVAPIPSGAQPGSDTLDTGSKCFVTQNAALPWLNSGTRDIDGGATTLTSPAFDALGGDAYISVELWYVNSFDNNTTPDDTLVIQISTDGGSTWNPFQTITANTLGWERQIWHINDFLAPTNNMRLRFIASDTGVGSLVECAIDELAVYVVDSSANAFDLNLDNTIDGADLGILLGGWGAPGLTDLNNDGTTGGADLGLLLGAWGLCVGHL